MAVKKHMHYPSMFLISSVFWNKIPSNEINFDDFTQIYAEALKEINLNQKINDMIKKCIEN